MEFLYNLKIRKALLTMTQTPKAIEENTDTLDYINWIFIQLHKIKMAL